MTVIIDLIGSMLIRASMLIIVLALVLSLNDSLFNQTTLVTAEENTHTIQQVMYTDLMRVIPDGIVASQNDRISFNAYTDSTMQYARAVTYDASIVDASTGCHKLYRTSGYRSYLIASNLVKVGSTFKLFTCYDKSGAETTYCPSINSIRVHLTVPVISKDTSYSTDEFTVRPLNLFK